MPRFERAVRCLLALQVGEPVGVHWMMQNLRLSRAQAKRDMLELERVLPLVRQRTEAGRSVLVVMRTQ